MRAARWSGHIQIRIPFGLRSYATSKDARLGVFCLCQYIYDACYAMMMMVLQGLHAETRVS